MVHISDLIPCSKNQEYYNEYDDNVNTKIPPSVSSLRVPSTYNFDEDVSRVFEGSFWSFIDICVRRPANHRVCLKEVLLNNDKLIWGPRFEPYFFSRFPIKNVEYFVFNALLRSEAELDAFMIHEALEHHPEETEDSYDSIEHLCDETEISTNYLNILRDILCTRSYKQIMEIENMYLYAYDVNLIDDIKSKLANDVSRFFISILNSPRSTNSFFQSNIIDIIPPDFFTDIAFYRKNKGKLIDAISTTSFDDIRKVCEHLKVFIHDYLKNGVSVISSLKHSHGSRLKKSIQAVCYYSYDAYSFFAIRLWKCLTKMDILGVISIIFCRAEIDLKNIIDQYEILYGGSLKPSLKILFMNHEDIFTRIIAPICGMDFDDEI